MSDNPNTGLLQKYNKQFIVELQKLNPRQERAVKSIDGPVLVIAGPGTGKTHILTTRVGHILLETDAQAHNILCLTFTDAGVHAMRERLLQLIGPEAHRVHIYTFHSFCNKVIQENLEVFGRHDLEPLSDLERVEIIRQVIDGLDIKHPLKRGRKDAYFYESRLYDLFQRMKREDWSVENIHEKIDEYLVSLPERPDYIYQRKSGENKKGDIKQWKLDEEKEKMERLRAAATLYPDYLQKMDDARRYDFDDMILWVLRAFETNEALLRSYQEQYLYFLVDEYQDTNGAQNSILQKLIAYWKTPNVFIVGDDDQSIFEFQGARLKNISDFYNDYSKEISLVVLQDNYRSSQHILDTSRAVINNNTNRITRIFDNVEKMLIARNMEFAQSHVLPHVAVYKNRVQEETDIVDQIERLWKQNFPLNEVAIIYARHKQAQMTIELMEKKGIPYNTKRRINILDLSLIVNFRMLLEYLYREFSKPFSGEHLLFKIMHFDFLGILPQDLAKLSLYMAEYEWEKRPMWRTVIADQSILKKLGFQNEAAISRFSSFIEELIGAFVNIPITKLIERLVNKSGLLHHILSQNDKTWYLQIMTTLLDFVKKESDKKPRLSVQELIETLSNMDANRLPLEVNKTIHSEKGVNLLTAHSSKGLEFQYVYMLDCVKEHWEPRSRQSNFHFPFPDTLSFSGEEDAMEARRRLFYVAMTRAKEWLHISYSHHDNRGKELQRAIYIDELLSETQIEVNHKNISSDLLLNAQVALLEAAQKPQINLPDQDYINELLKNFTLSISVMNKYLRCPLSFYYENVLRVPSVSSQAASYGTAMHYALQRLFDKMAISKTKSFPSEEMFIRFFKQEMMRQRGNFTEKEFDHRMKIGHQHLSDYYKENNGSWHKQVQAECNIKNVQLDGVPLNGTIDKIELHPDQKVHLVDYKTGSQTSSKLSKPTAANELGGIYWRQLVFYKILYELYAPGRQATSAEIAYLEPNSRGKFIRKEIKFDPKQVQLVKGMITETYKKIMQHKFYEGCGEARCQWCNFVRQNVASDSFVNVEVEELDD